MLLLLASLLVVHLDNTQADHGFLKLGQHLGAGHQGAARGLLHATSETAQQDQHERGAQQKDQRELPVQERRRAQHKQGVHRFPKGLSQEHSDRVAQHVRVADDSTDGVGRPFVGEVTDGHARQVREHVLAQLIDARLHDLLSQVVLVELRDASDGRDDQHGGHQGHDGDVGASPRKVTDHAACDVEGAKTGLPPGPTEITPLQVLDNRLVEGRAQRERRRL